MNFIKQFFSIFVSIFICIVILPIALIISLLIFASNDENFKNQTATNNISSPILDYNLSIPIYENPQTENATLKFFFNKMPTIVPSLSTFDICEAIKSASFDDSKKNLFIYGKLPPEISLAQVEEIRHAISKFSKTKHTIAYLENPTQLEYYLASAAKSLVLNPSSDFSFKGLSANPIFFGKAFKKYGIKAQVVKSGKYKNFANIFTENKLNPEDKQHLSELIGNIWENILHTISAERKISIDALKNISAQKPIMTAQEALQLGFVNQLLYADEMITTISKIAGKKDSKFERDSIENYVYTSSAKEKLALVYMSGDITETYADGVISADRFVPLLRKIRKDKSTKAVVIRIDSGGGSAYASELIRREVELLAKTKPVVISMGATCASGGYWIATAASKILADSTTITGSIGVVSVIFSAEKLANDFGITFDCVKTSPFADIFNASHETSQEGLDKIKPLLESTYEKFVRLVADSRKMKFEQAQNLADGRVYTGLQAKALKLCDEIGTLENAIVVAKNLSKNNNLCIEQFPKTNVLDELLGTVEEVGIFSKNTHLKILQKSKKLAESFDSKKGIQAKAPIQIQLR